MNTFKTFQHRFMKLGLAALLLTHGISLAEETAQKESVSEKALKDPIVQTPPLGKIPRVLVNLSKKTKFAFVVDKDLRTLSLWKNAQVPSLFAAYPTDMGKKPGNKLYQGDYKTPEGIYFFQETYEQPNLDFNLYGQRAFTMDYPNYFDRLENKTGGGIWLHAIPDSQSLNRGSRGCVVVRNQVIEKLKNFIELGKTPVIVQDKVDYISVSDWKDQRNKKELWLKEWKQAWESKKIDDYISFYHENFKALGMGKNNWKKYKEELNGKYSFIKVEVEDMDIFKHDDQFIFRFTQKYESNSNKDLGEKILYVQSVDGQLKILSEQWRELDSPSNAQRVLSSNDSSENPG